MVTMAIFRVKNGHLKIGGFCRHFGGKVGIAKSAKTPIWLSGLYQARWLRVDSPAENENFSAGKVGLD